MSYLRRALRNVWTAVVMSGMCWCQSVEPPAPSILAGRVVSQLDGKPIKGAVVQLHNSSSGFPMPGAAFSGRTSTTSENGAYAFSNVEPGNYRLLVQREGYTPGVYGGRYLPGAIVEVAASRSWKNLDIEMSPHGSISGVVTNADGQAAQRVHVSALRMGFASGRRSFTPYSFTDTDAEGSFMLKGLPAGRYSIRVDQGAGLRVAGSADKRQRGVLEQTIARTYYPNAETIEAAIPVPVDPGAEVTGIRVRVKPGVMFRVTGHVDWGGLAAPAKEFVLALVTTSWDVNATIRPHMAAVQRDGSFTFEEVTPGDYFLEPARVFVDPGENRKYAGVMEVRVRDRDVQHVRFRVDLASDLAGRIRMAEPESNAAELSVAAGKAPRLKAPENTPPKPQPPPGQEAAPQAEPAPLATVSDVSTEEEPTSLSEVAIRLVASDRLQVNSPRAISGRDGSFRFEAVPAGRYRIVTTNLPEGTFVRSLSFNGREVKDVPLDLTSGGGGDLHVVLSREAATITGTVRGPKDAPLPGVQVSIWSAQAAHVVVTDQRGVFRAGNLAPGKYRAAAWQEIEPGLADWIVFCRLFEADAASVPATERGSQSVSLTPVSASAIQEAIWKLPLQ